jgi:hypothetical protein
MYFQKANREIRMVSLEQIKDQKIIVNLFTNRFYLSARRINLKIFKSVGGSAHDRRTILNCILQHVSVYYVQRLMDCIILDIKPYYTLLIYSVSILFELLLPNFKLAARG